MKAMAEQTHKIIIWKKERRFQSKNNQEEQRALSPQ